MLRKIFEKCGLIRDGMRGGYTEDIHVIKVITTFLPIDVDLRAIGLKRKANFVDEINTNIINRGR